MSSLINLYKKIKINKKRFLILEILSILLISLIPLIWFKPEQMVYGSDSGYPLDFVGYFLQRTFTWTSSQNFGRDMSTFMGAVPLHGIQYVLSLLKVPYFDIQKVTFIFWFAAISFSMYACVRYFFKESGQWMIRIIAVLIYVLNFHIFLFWQIGSQTTLSVYALLPLVFLITYKFINRDISAFRTAIYLNLSYLFFNGGGIGGVPLLGPVIVVGFGLIIYQLFIKFEKSFIIEVFKLSITSFFLFFVLNAYFLLPFLSSFTQQFNTLVNNSGGISGVIEWTRFISKFDSYSNLFRLQGDNIWYVNNYSYPLAYLTNPLLIILSFVFPILAYFNLLFNFERRIKKLIIGLILLSLIGIFLSAGSHEPLGFLYELMLKYIPGFAAFRSAYYKFIPLVYFCFAILDGIAIYYIIKKINFKYKYLISIVFIIFLFLYHYPFFQSKNFLTNNKYSTMIKVPDYVREFARLTPTNDKYRTLVLPPLNNGYPVEAYTWDYYSGYPVFPGMSDKSFIINNPYLNTDENPIVNQLYNYLRDGNLDAFLSSANNLAIKYILITSDIYTNIPDTSREDGRFYKQKLTKQNFNLIWENKQWSLYEIVGANIKPKIYAFNSLDLYDGSLENLPLEVQNTQFIKKDQAQPETISILPISNNILKLTCASCDYLNKEYLDLSPGGLTPDSILFPLKRYLELRSFNNITDDKEIIHANLGLSLKRIKEMWSLAEVKRSNNSTSWNQIFDLLQSNWNEINLLSKKENIKYDSLVVNKVARYAQVEIKNLKQIYSSEIVKDSANLQRNLKKTISQVAEVQKNNPLVITEFSNRSVFVYGINQSQDLKSMDLMIDVDSLLKDSLGNMLYPYAIKVDNGQLINLQAPSKSKVIKLPKLEGAFKRLYLYFPSQENQFNNTNYEIIKFPDKEESCLVSGINNYKWYKTYQITSKINGSSDYANVYIKNIKENSKGDNKVLFFEYDKIIDIQKYDKASLNLNILGKENYPFVRIYFCTDLNHQPETVFTDIKAKTMYEPIVYFKNNNSIKTYISPSISYKKINPTEYLITIQDVRSPFFLSFSDRHSEFWKLFDSNGNIINDPHFILNGYTNGWYIKKTGTYEIKLKYTQQNIFMNGVRISAITFFLIIFYLIINTILSPRNKRLK